MVLKVGLVAGARPNFMKIAPLVWASREVPIEPVVIHTGQHYDYEMSKAFFWELGLGEPDVYLGVGSGSHAVQTARALAGLRGALRDLDGVVVVGDVNSTLAGALAAKELGIPLIHLEAGLRSGRLSQPEEINRLVADSLADLLLAPSHDAAANLLAEGVPPERVVMVGNIMIDALMKLLPKARKPKGLPLGPSYGILTLHRPENVDDARVLGGIMEAVREVARELALVFPVHPRTKQRLAAFGIGVPEGVIPTPPLPYTQLLGLMRDARVVLTDSGGIQEETTVLGVQCITIRETTERPITVWLGTNRVVGREPEGIIRGFREALENPKKPQLPPLWDGKTGPRALRAIREFLNG